MENGIEFGGGGGAQGANRERDATICRVEGSETRFADDTVSARGRQSPPLRTKLGVKRGRR